MRKQWGSRQKNWTRNVISIWIFQVFHPTDVEIKASKRFLSAIRTQVIWLCFFFNWNNISRTIRGFVNNIPGAYYHGWFWLSWLILAMIIMLLTTWNLLDFRVAEKEIGLPRQYLFAQPWWSRLLRWSFLAIHRISKVISRKLIGQIVLHGPYVLLLF